MSESFRPRPSIGRVVHYRLSEADAEEINHHRRQARFHMDHVGQTTKGGISYIGDDTREGDVFPMIIVRLAGEAEYPERINGTVWLDGSDTFWARSVDPGDAVGQWFWPPRV